MIRLVGLVLALCLRRSLADVPIVGLDHKHDVSAIEHTDVNVVHDVSASERRSGARSQHSAKMDKVLHLVPEASLVCACPASRMVTTAQVAVISTSVD